MSSRPTPIVSGYAMALAAAAITVGLGMVARDQLGISPTLTILGGLLVAAWFGGRGPGLLFCVLTAVGVDYLFDGTPYEFGTNPITHIVRLVILATVSLLISSLKNAKTRLEIRARQQAAVAEFGRIALAGNELKKLLTEAVGVVKDTLRVEAAGICEVDVSNEEMVFAAATGWKTSPENLRFGYKDNGSLAGLVAASSEPVVVPDLLNDNVHTGSKFVQAEGFRSLLAVRVMPRAGIYGILGAFDSFPRKYSSDDVNFLQAIANIIAEAVDRFRADEDVRAQRTWFETTLTSIGDGVIATDRDGRVIFLNTVAQKLTGWDDESARGRELSEVFRIINESTRLPADDPVARVIETGKIAGLANHTILIARDGREFPIEDRAAPIRKGDEITGAVLVFSDVTDRKLAQRLVIRRAREIAALYGFTDRLQRAGTIGEVYDAALDSISGAVHCDRASILLFDESGVMQFVAWQGLSDGYRAAASGHSPWKHGESGVSPIGITDIRQAGIEEELKNAISDEGISALGFIPLISNERLIGKLMIYFNEPHEFTEAEFELAMTVANQIAPGVERRRSEARLLENEERLRLATQAGKVGVWDWDIRANRVEWTDALYEIHGLRKGEFAGTVEGFAALVHPEDRTKVQQSLERSLESGRPYSTEFRTVRPDGEIRWLLTNARVITDEEGPQRLIGATADITERVKAEAARRENEIMQRLVEAQESERQRIARDLHDHLGQKMTGLRFKIESALSHVPEDSELQTLLDEIQESALQIDQDIGFLSWELRPTELDTLGLDDALASFVREWSSQYAINAEFHSNLSDTRSERGRLPRTLETNLYRIAQEGLNNIMKHANAESVSVLLQYRKDSLVLIIEDNGAGLPDGYNLNAGKSNGSFGLIGMHERAALLKGTFEVESRAGRGTTLITTVPLYKVFAGAAG